MNDGHQPPDPGEVVTDADVEQLDDAELRRHVARLSTTVRVLSGSVARLSGAPPVDLDQPGAAERTNGSSGAAGEELVEWVQWLVARYELHNIPDCWTLHGALVEELDALRIGWLDTIGKGQRGLAATQWHYYFGQAMERIDRRWRARNCEDTHRETMLPGWVTETSDALDTPDLDAGRYRRRA